MTTPTDEANPRNACTNTTTHTSVPPALIDSTTARCDDVSIITEATACQYCWCHQTTSKGTLLTTKTNNTTTTSTKKTTTNRTNT